MPPRSGGRGPLFSNGLVGFLVGALAACRCKHTGTPLLHCSSRSIGKQTVKKKRVKKKRVNWPKPKKKAAQVIDSAEQRILSPYQPCGPRPVPFVPHPLRANPGPSMPPPTAKMRSPQAANRRTGERERERRRDPCLLPCPRARPEPPPPGFDAPTVTCR